jgi:serine phosphatase RsbU (regulator of sigma subunit)
MRARVHVVSVIVLVVALAITGLAASLTTSSHRDIEQRLLDQRVEAAATVFMGTLPGLTAPLVGAAALAEETGGDEDALEGFLAPQVGEDAAFASVSVWPVDGSGAPALVVGDQPRLADLPPEEIQAFLDRAVGAPDLAVLDLLDETAPSLGYGATSPLPEVGYVVYAENSLPPDRLNRSQPASPFQDLDYALYLGTDDVDEDLLIANQPDLPLDGHTGRTTIAFGDAELLLVLQPQGDLGGSLAGRLPGLILLVGGLLSLTGAALAERLFRSRDAALALAEENQTLYDEQRSVADVVQQSLLPRALPAIDGLELEVRYRPGVVGTEVGGDWYDVVALDDDRVLVVVGDVAGRGIRAATIMAMLRHATRAYAVQGDDPVTLPAKLTHLMRLDGDSGFATVVLVELDLRARTATVVNAGHPRPLLIDGDRRFVDAPIGLPVGVQGTRPQGSAQVDVAPGTTLLAFTDGLFERRGESVDDGMERLRATVDPDRPLAAVLDGLLDDLASGSEPDDVAIVGVRW